jgi:hypothetical protein
MTFVQRVIALGGDEYFDLEGRTANSVRVSIYKLRPRYPERKFEVRTVRTKVDGKWTVKLRVRRQA